MTTLEARARERGDATSTSFDGDEITPRDGGAREVDRERWVARARERLRDGAGGTRAGRRRRRRGAWTRARALGGVVVGAWAVRGVGVADGASVLTKGVARNGFVSASAYKYYKVNVACVESAQPLTLELTTSNGNADLYVSRTSQPSTGTYEHRSMNTGNALDSVTISSPTNGYYYVSVYGTLSSTYKIRARTTMFTGKHPCTGFRITDSDVSSVGSGSGNAFILQDALTVSAAAGFTADLSVDGNVILGDAYADSVTVKGEIKLGVTDSTYYSITRQPPTSPSSNPGGALAVIGANATNQGGSVTVLGGTGGTGAGGAVTVEAGAATSGNGGTLTLRGGTSNSGTGGDVVIDAGDSTTQASTYEGVIHIGPNAASYVRVGESSNKQVQTDIFGDLTVHGNLLTTNDLVFGNSYTSYVQISTTQDGMFHQELRAPKLTGLDAEDITGTPTSSLTIDAGTGGSEKHVIIAPTEAAAVYIGSTSANVPISLRQGASATDYRLYADSNGKLTLTSSSNQDVSVTAGGTGSITLTPGDDFTVDAGDDVSIDAAGSLFLKQDSTNILSWNDAGAVTVSAVSGQDLTMSGDDVVLKSEASSTLALKQDSTNILSWDAAGAVTVSAVSNQDVSVLSNAASSGTGGAVSISGGASTTSTTGVGGALTLSGGAGGSASGGAGGAVTVSSGAAHTSGAVTISSGAGATTNGGIVVDAKTGAGTAGAITVRQGSSSGDRLVVSSAGAVTVSAASNQDVSVTAGGTGSITLTPGDDFTVDAGDDVSIDAAGSLFLKQDSTNILSWNDAGAVTVSAVSGQDLTMSGDDVVLKSEASSTLALKQDSTNILSWDAAGAVTVSAVSNQDVSVLSNAASSGTGGAVSISGGASTTSTTGVGGALTLSGGAGGSASGGAGGAVTVSSGAAHTSGAVTISSGAGATTNGGIVVDAKTGAGTAGAITVRQGSSSGDRLVVSSAGAVTVSAASNQDVSVTAGGTGSITLTPGDDFTVDAGDDVSIDAAGSLFLKQDSTNILSWNDAGAVTLSSVEDQPISIAPLGSSTAAGGAVSLTGGGASERRRRRC